MAGNIGAQTNVGISNPAGPQITAANPYGLPNTMAPANPAWTDPNNPGGYFGATSNSNPSQWSSFQQGANQFLASPLGQTATYATIGTAGMLEARQANAEAAKLAGSISTLGQPYSASGAQQLAQIQPGLQTGTAESSAAANELGQVAMQYGTGQLTPAQQQQVTTYVQQQRAQLDSALAGSGNLNSSARGAQYQQIDNNAAMLTQQLIQGNIQMAQGALQAVQSTYSSMLNQALAQSQFGLGAQQAAVALQIQSNAQVSGQLQQLFAALAQGMGGANKGGTQGGGGNAVQQFLQKMGGGGGNVNAQTVPGIGQDVGASTAVPGAYTPTSPLGDTPLQTPGQLGMDQLSAMNMPDFNIDTGGAQSFAADNPQASVDTSGGG